MTESDKQFDIVIVGAGPCGVTLANHLGLYGVRTLIVDRSTAILDYPRAVGMDDEALRSFQAVGLAEPLLADMIRNVPARYHTAGGWCFAHVHPQEQPFGWSRRNLFIQPIAERTLRRGLDRYETVRLDLGVSLLTLVEEGDGVLATLARADGTTYAVSCAYLVGADGGRSTVRGLIDVRLEGKTDAARWLVVDMQNDDLDSPYSSVFAHRHHPRMSIALPYGHRRFEFRLPDAESDEAAVAPERLAERLRLFYGAAPRRANVVRARVYRHHSRIAERFQVGRVFLAGDAAHLQPPFFGQGMNSGLRDATNLGWKLAAVLRGLAGPRLLESYEAERHDHARKMVNIATMFGRLYSPGSRALEVARDLFFRIVQRMPRLRDYVLQMKFKPIPRYTEGLVLPATDPTKEGIVGRMFMQPLVETADHRSVKLDDALGPWFTVIGIGADPSAAMSADSRKFWADIGANLVLVRPSRSEAAAVSDGVIVIEDLMGAFRDWRRARPAIRFIVLRPDRYVAAVAGDNELDSVSEQLRSLLRT
ncbi:MAG: bifunctional 3-(3-hydroxy-phenyl)propionate/3-hydroxycinnamic acid hydroxylase [Qipengyuania sp.]|nr:bifunctional 3-(3-hydroxy-phenyl)propionate/3-hydroxycinnamic acid hydroxylase [Qipengyuania sp.]